MAQLDFVHHWVFANGSVTWHHGRSEMVRGIWLAPDVARRLVAELRDRLPGVGFAVEREASVAYEPGFEAVVPRPLPVPPTDDVTTELHGRVQKILVFRPGSTEVDSLFAAVVDAVGDRAAVSYAGLPFVEVAAELVTKATALERLASDLGLEPARVVAFGDNHNDVSMLRWAGRSFAMANASDDAKAAAGEVIGTNDADAVADKVDELVAEIGRS